MAKEEKTNVPVRNEGGSKSASLLHPIAEIERAFDRLLGKGWPSWGRWRDLPAMESLLQMESIRVPSLDVIDRDNEIVVRAEVPGIEKKDLSVSLTDNLLTIKGESGSEKKEEKGDYHREEISKSSFSRSVTLPGTVDASKTNASLKDGLLEITLPKLEASRRKNITVK